MAGLHCFIKKENIMKKAMLILVYLMFSINANAASFNFAAIADTGEFGASSIAFVSPGLTVTATALTFGDLSDVTYRGGDGPANAYLDSGNAGLGVCKTLTPSNQCTPSSDDNVQSGEALGLSFDRTVTLGEIDFKNGQHGNTFSTDENLVLQVWLNGVTSLYSYALLDMIDFNLRGDEFVFFNTFAGTSTGEQFYISALNAEVPVPAALFLFAPALLGFLGLRRKAKSALAV
ncbi:MAG: hypothetical protein ACJAS1_006829 [Oleiphilaceae bacterium]|jgi:hypothetical protein